VDPAEENKKKAWTMLMNGTSFTGVKQKLGADAGAAAIKAVMAEITMPTPEEITMRTNEELSRLAEALMPKARKGDEVSINAIVRIKQVQQQLILTYAATAPYKHEETELERFRKEKEARQQKNTSKYKP